MKYTLLVIDMQQWFDPKINTIVACKRTIKKAVKDKAFILFVEYYECGRTMKELLSLVENYNNIFYVIKKEDNGSKYVQLAMNHLNLPIGHIKVCGVNTDECVQQTILGLQKLYADSNIEVIANACNADEVFFHETAINLFVKRGINITNI